MKKEKVWGWIDLGVNYGFVVYELYELRGFVIFFRFLSLGSFFCKNGLVISVINLWGLNEMMNLYLVFGSV